MAHRGKCALCGSECELTFEHIPPKKAFNEYPAKTVSGNDLLASMERNDSNPWDLSKHQYKNNQKGMGLYSLCSRCNSFTGTRYGNEYINFAHGFQQIIKSTKPVAGMTMFVENASFRPLPVIKQVISMFCSVNQNISHPIFDILKKFVLEENSSFPKNEVKLGMYICVDGIFRRCPLSFCGSIKDNKIHLIGVSEISTYPLGFLLYLTEGKEFEIPCLDITDFCDYQYNDECIMEMELPIYECNSIIIGDFRTKQEIERVANNEKKVD